MIQGAQSIYRSTAILETLLRSTNGKAARDIAQSLDLPLSTTHRILAVFCERGLVVQDSNTHLFGPGPLLSSDPFWEYKQKLYSRYADLPQLIVNEFGYTGYLYCRMGYSYQCLSRAEGIGAVQVFSSYQGEVRYLGDGAGSFGILAFLDPEERKNILTANIPFFRDRLLRSEQELIDTIEAAAKNGFGSGRDFRVPGTGALSVPIYHRGLVTGALSVSGMYDEHWRARQADIIARMKTYIQVRQQEV